MEKLILRFEYDFLNPHKVELSTDYDGTLNLSFTINNDILEDICEHIYYIMDMDDWLDSLNFSQIEAIKDRFCSKELPDENI